MLLVLGSSVSVIAPLGAQRQAQPASERELLAIPDTASVRAMTRDLSARPHMAGTPADTEARNYTLAKLASYGLVTWTKQYVVYMPQPDTIAAWILSPAGRPPVQLDLDEPPLGPGPGAGATIPAPVPPFNAYSGNGDVTGDVVYVNYGLIRDYQTLDSLGVGVRGRIALARYGGSFRGIKEREAERRGALGLILYSDPQDDGYVRGDVYPDGPMRPPEGIQRGSVLLSNGDPTTPSWPSTPGAKRVPEESLPVPRIPVIPMGYGNARRLLAQLEGASVPEPWQGGLPFHYHTGPGPTRVRLKVTNERGRQAFHPIWDTFGMLRGTRYPDEWVVVGAHRDAWSPGAADNVSGVVTVLETARAFGELARRGFSPARTIIFATWDAEEWGLIGSTEWVEELEDTLTARVVAYVNEDDITTGPHFTAAAAPSLKPFIRDLTRAVPNPVGPGSVYDAWQMVVAGDTSALQFDDLGGGSDFAGFSHHLGIASLAVGFEGLGGTYHSMYDSYDWMNRFGDPRFVTHRAAAQLVSLATLRLANATILPFDYAAFAMELTALESRIDTGIAQRRWGNSTAPLKGALANLGVAARVFASVRDSALAAGIDSSRAVAANHWLMQVERRLTRPDGLGTRPWYRSLEFASDMDNGYSTMVFPSVNEALRYGDPATVDRELRDLVQHIDAARDALERATRALR